MLKTKKTGPTTLVWKAPKRLCKYLCTLRRSRGCEERGACHLLGHLVGSMVEVRRSRRA